MFILKDRRCCKSNNAYLLSFFYFNAAFFKKHRQLFIGKKLILFFVNITQILITRDAQLPAPCFVTLAEVNGFGCRYFSLFAANDTTFKTIGNKIICLCFSETIKKSKKFNYPFILHGLFTFTRWTRLCQQR